QAPAQACELLQLLGDETADRRAEAAPHAAADDDEQRQQREERNVGRERAGLLGAADDAGRAAADRRLDGARGAADRALAEDASARRRSNRGDVLRAVRVEVVALLTLAVRVEDAFVGRPDVD